VALDVGLVNEVLANLFGAFSGFSLALLADRKYRRQQDLRQQEHRKSRYLRARESIAGSVVKNVAAARRIAKGQDAAFDLEDAVWVAVRDEFIETAPTVDERVVVARFFEHVDHLQAAAHRCQVLEDEGRASPAVVAATRARLAAWARDVELAGKWLIADHGNETHRAMLGEDEAHEETSPLGSDVAIERF
jgi:hypothetical protein